MASKTAPRTVPTGIALAPRANAQRKAACSKAAKVVSGQRAAGFSGSCKALKNQRTVKCTRTVNVTRAAVTDAEIATRDTTAPLSKTVLSIILGGGAGSRLYPLTKQRAKPAVPIGGAYRLIDVPMSNCLNSGIDKMYILTQFNSVTLNRHLARAYNFRSLTGFVEVLAATQTPTNKEWFQGTADAVRQYAWLIEDVKNKDVQDVIILSGDHLYRMDYSDFIKTHRETNADITVSCLPMDDERASDFGLMKIDDTGKIIDFAEKPSGDDLKAMAVDTTVLGLGPEEAKEKPYIASMGIYVFRKQVLCDLLLREFPDCNDFGGEILPKAAGELRVQAHLFDDYWEDIGTIKSFFEANLALAKKEPLFEFYDANNPIFTSPRFLPPAKITNSKLEDSIVSHGAYLEECSVKDAIVGLRSRVLKGCKIDRAMIMGADFYETDAERADVIAAGGVPLGIGENCEISNTIVDKNARVGNNCVITNAAGVEEAKKEEEGYYIRSGIVTILRGAVIPDGTVI